MRIHSKATLAGLRKMNSDNLPDLAEVVRPVHTKIPGGGTSTDYMTDFFTPCRITPFGSTPRQTVIAGTIAHPAKSWTVVLSEGTIIAEDAIVIITSSQGWAKTLKVVAVSGPHTVSILTYVIGEETII